MSTADRFAKLPANVRAALLARLERSRPAVEPREEPRAPLSHAQQRLWAHHRANPTSPAYHMPAVLRLDGELDPAALARALGGVRRRHEVLRSRIGDDERGPWQEPFEAPPELSIEHVRPADPERWIAALLRRPFAVAEGEVMRAALVEGGTERWLVVVLHHIAADGLSLPVLVGELASLYDGALSGASVELPPLPVQYADYAVWQRRELEGDAMKRHLAFWREALTGSVPLGVAPDRAAVATTDEAVCVPLARDPALHEALATHAREAGTTAFVSWLGLWSRFLTHAGREREVTIGVPHAGRAAPELERLIGFFVNPLPYRVASRSGSLRTSLTGWKDGVDAVREHERTPFDAIVRALGPELDRSHSSPVYQAMLAFQNQPEAVFQLGGVASTVVPSPAFAKADLTLEVEPGREARLVARASRYSLELTRALAGGLESFLRRAAENPDAELSVLLSRGASAAVPAQPRASAELEETTTSDTLAVRIARSLADGADAVLVEGDGRQWTGAQLEERSASIAGGLRSRGVAPGDRVALRLERKTDLVAAILAVWRLGASYLPLDPSWPRGRWDSIRDDARPALALTDDDAGWPGMAALSEVADAGATVDEWVPAHPASEAYVIYTSGSTGRPKGVSVSRRGLGPLADAQIPLFGLQGGGTTLSFASPAFDAFVSELLTALLSGGRLAFCSAEARADHRVLQAELRASDAVVATLPPGLWMVLEPSAVPDLRTVVTAGEACPVELVQRWHGRRVVNAYGPTENTVCATALEVELDETAARVPIGPAIPAVHAVVMDEAFRPCPVGVIGELCLGGDQVALGYLGRGALTAERFVPDPEGRGQRLYRTGDLCRRTPSGALEILGRADAQVKLRGFRIELGEIEALLSRDPDVRGAAVAVASRPRPHLVAWVAAEEDDTVGRAVAALSAELPPYMIPSRVLRVDAIHRSTAGKVDRRAHLATLPSTTEAAAETSEGADAPELSGPAGIVARAFERILETSGVGLDTDFFAAGGDSIVAMQLVAALAEEGLSLAVRDVFEAPTVQGMASRATTGTAIDQGPSTGTATLLPLQEEQLAIEPGRDHFTQALLLDVTGPLEPDELRRAITDLVEHHDALRLRFERDANGTWVATFGEVAGAVKVEALTLETDAELAGALERALADIRLEGPLGRATLLRTPSGLRLHLAFHHQVVDGVSWRILVDHLDRRLRGAPLPPKTTSFAAWSSAVAGLAMSRDEVAHWREVERAAQAQVLGFGSGTTFGTRSAATFTLDEATTTQVLRGRSSRLGAGPEELLLAGLVQSLGAESTVVTLESHGRHPEHVDPDIDLSRTVGWFTTTFPVALAHRDELDEQVVAIKNAVRRVPRGGLGHGTWRREHGATPPELVFNYLGQSDGASTERLSLASDDAGPMVAAERPWESLAATAIVEGGQLVVTVEADRRHHERLQRLAERWAEAMADLSGALERTTPGPRAASDYALVPALSQADLEALAERYDDLEDIWPLTATQHAIYLEAVRRPTLYFAQYVIDVEGDLDAELEALRDAFVATAAAHPAARVAIAELSDGTPVQVVRRAPIPWREERVDSVDLDEWRRQDREAGFDLGAGPMIRGHVRRFGPDRATLLLSAHHVAFDGWSGAVFLADVVARLRGRDVPERATFAEHLRTRETHPRERVAEAFRAHLSSDGETGRSLLAEGASGRIERTRTTVDAGAVRAVAAAAKVTPATVLTAAFARSLMDETGGDEALLAVTSSGRPPERPRLAGAVGLFIDTLPLLVRGGAQPAAEGLARLQADAQAVRRFTGVPLGEALRAGGRPVPEALFVFQNYPVDPELAGGVVDGGLQLSLREAVEASQFGVALSVSPQGEDGLELLLQSDTSLSEGDPGWAERFLQRVEAWTRHWASDAQSLTRPPLGGPDRQRLELLEAGEPAGPATDVVERFATVAAEHRDEVAVRGERGSMSFGELEGRVGDLAQRLANAGIGVGERVAVIAERAPDTLVALWAILVRGATYVPIDPSLPPERARQMIAASGAGLVLAASAPADRVPAEVDVLAIEGGLAPLGEWVPARPELPAYVIFTSGSTGGPKPVVVGRGALAHLMTWLGERYAPAARGSMVWRTSPGFDASLHEMVLPTLLGEAIVIAPDIAALEATMDAAADLQLTPSLAAALGSVQARRLFLGGEALSGPAREALRARCQEAYNHYGPTEVCVNSVTLDLSEAAGSASIGRPVPGLVARILDDAGDRCPVGVVGELYLAGPQVALGYAGAPALTAARFVPDPFGPPGSRMYRTGDLARWRDDGNIDYEGRRDGQVKLRGFRVELGEIEAAMAALPGVAAAAAVVRADRLDGYVVGDVDLDEVRERLSAQLPGYMVPETLTPLDELPLTSSGKLDRRRLPEPRHQRADFEPPVGESETGLAALWEQLLGVARVGRHDDFFALGGHSLLATRLVALVRAELGRELSLRALFDHPTLSRMAQALADQLAAPPLRALGDDAANGLRPASYGQERLWMLDRMAPDSAAYHMPAFLRVEGSLDPARLEGALGAVVDRHEVLRTRLVQRDGQLLQEVVEAGPFVLERRTATPTTVEDDARAWMALPFALDQGQVLRAALYDLGEGEQLLAFCMHHIASDGVSMEILVRELQELYAGGTLPALPVQYADYARWQREWMEGGGELERQLGYWREQLRSVEPLAVPTDHPRPPVVSDEAGEVPVVVPKALSDRVRAFAREQGTTPYVVWLSLFAAVLGRLGRQDDLAIGSPVANRRDAKLEGLIGFFVNTVVQRVDLGGTPSLEELVARTHDVALRTQEHQDAPFEQVVKALDVPRDVSTTPLFQAMLAYQEADAAPDLSLGEASLHRVDLGAPAKFDLDLSLRSQESGTEGRLTYRSTLYERASMERLVDRLLRLAEGALARPSAPLARLPIIPPEEHEWALRAALGGGEPAPSDDCVTRIRAAYREHAEAIALRGTSRTVTYAELGERVVRLAAALRAQGVEPGMRVGLAMLRSVEVVECILAVWEAGAAFVPLDPELPAERLRFMVDDVAPRVVLSDGRTPLPTLPAEARVIAVNELELDEAITLAGSPSPVLAPEAHAFLLYTSGSTGRPKGVVISHGALAAFTGRACEIYPRPASSVLHGTLTFDLTIFSFLDALVSGGEVVVADPDVGVEPLRTTLTARTVASVVGTPSHLEAVGELRGRSTTWLVGGEVLPPHLVERDVRVFNVYGPTENTVISTTWDNASDTRLSIGKPFAGVGAYVLSRELELCGIGMSGELYLSGLQLAEGYFRRPGLTADRFVPNPFGEPGSRLYRTGDLVRWLDNGELDFIGRADNQVKVRGYRIELGEVEACLEQDEEVRRGATVVRDGRLDGYVVLHAEADPGARTRILARLGEKLPAYMVPGTLTVMADLPLTPSGKIDRRSLPEPELDQTTFEPPVGEMETALAQLWAELLGVSRVGRGDDFFDLGGHSLTGTQLVARIRTELGRELGLRAVFENPTLAGMAAVLAAQSGDQPTAPPLRRSARDGEPLRASYGQERLWLLSRLAPESAAYHIPAFLRVEGHLDPSRLEAALRELVTRHEILRTRLVTRDGHLVQVVDAEGRVALERREATRAELNEDARAWMARPFALDEGEVLRAALYELDDGEQILAFCMHHIASDGTSLEVLVAELRAHYGGTALPELPIQYVDYARWQREWMEAGGELERQLGYWREQLRSVEPLALPTDRPRPPVLSDEAGAVPVVVPEALATRLRAFARAQGTTPYVVWLSLFGAVLGRLGRQADLTIGSPVANRRDVKLEPLIGFFVNTVVQRLDLSGAPSLEELVARTHEIALRTQDHQDAPFEKVVEALDVPRDTSSTPLFQAMLAYQEMEAASSLSLGDATLHPIDLGAPAKFDLNLALVSHEAGARGTLSFRASLYERASMERLVERLLRLADEALAQPNAPLARLRLVAPEERERVLRAATPQPANAAADCVTRLRAAFREHAPAVALRSGNRSITYGELGANVQRIASALRRDHRVGPGVRVGIAMARSVELIECLLAVWEAGAAWVPLDPELPAERLRFMVSDAAPSVVLTDPSVSLPALPEGTRVVTPAALSSGSPLAEPVGPLPAGAHAYLLYTSGSTGRPKGVVVSHGALAAYLARACESFPRLDSSILHGTLSFDATLSSFLPVLLAGGEVELAPPDVGAEPLRRVLAAREVGLAKGTPSHLEAVGDEARRAASWVLGGEPLSPHLVAPNARVLNQYGPTENTIGSTLWDSEWGTPVSIGRPFPGVGAHVLDGAMEPCGVGTVGELYLSGDQLAEGYHHRPRLTAERFLPNPFGPPGSRLYRTGDLVRWLDNGELAFIGRADDQVKVRGHRIELGEVEAQLERDRAVRRAAVVVRDARLDGYVVLNAESAADRRQQVEPILHRLREQLPAYMVPTTLTPLDDLPLTPSGKVDRRSLPEPELDHAAFEPPEGEREEALARIWRELLGVARVGRSDDFFALGGHSLAATQLAARVRADLGRELKLRSVFEASTLSDMALALTDESSAPPLRPVPRDEAKPLPASYGQERLWTLSQLAPGSAAYHMPAFLRVEGTLDPERLEAALRALVARHEVLRTRLATDGGRLVQRIDDDASIALERRKATEATVRADARAWMARPFALDQGEVLRAALYQLEGGDQLLAFCMHHIASDGISMSVLVRELAGLYEGAELAPLPVQYADYAAWQRRWMEETGELDRQLAHWTERLRAAEPLALPTDHPRPPVLSDEAGEVLVDVPRALSDQLRAFAGERGTTPYVVWLSLFAALLGRLGRQEDLSIGSPVANRRDAQLEGLIGFFVNTIVQRIDLRGAPSFEELVARTHEVAVRSQEHQDAPFEQVVKALEVPRDTSSTPVFQVMLAYQEGAVAEPSLPLGDATLRPIHLGTPAKFDLDLTLRSEDAGTRGVLVYRSSLYEHASMERLVEQLLRLAESAMAEPSVALPRLDVNAPMDAAALRRIEAFEAGEPIAPATSLAERFRAVVDERADAVAVEWQGDSLSFDELAGRVGDCVRRLDAAGVGVGDRVAVVAERTADVLAAFWALLHRGVTYVPIDPKLPPERAREMIARSGARVVLAGSDPAAILPPGARALALASGSAPLDAPVPAPPELAAYVIFTSGSTGGPKPVLVGRGALAHLMNWLGLRYASEERGAMVWRTSPGFDASIHEMLLPTLLGEAIRIAPDVAALTHAMDAETDLQLTPSLAAALGTTVRARRLFLGGEALSGSQRSALRDLCQEAYNHYGPTEVCVNSVTLDLSESASPTSIGRPVPGIMARILDDHGERCPVGAMGELYLAGPQVALGYDGAPGLTAARFVPDPFGPPGSRMYRTGDLARWRADGNIDYLGRRDAQVKVRGFRIELGEIEATLAELSSVAQSAVVARDGRLDAYIVLQAGAADDVCDRARALLRERLPEYMVPGTLSVLPALPLTPSGKVDRRALPAPAIDRSGYRAPEGPLELAVAAEWSRLLGVDRVGRDDDFFELGGHSLLALGLARGLSNLVGHPVSAALVFARPRLAEMAGALETDLHSPLLVLEEPPGEVEACVVLVPGIGHGQVFRPLSAALGPDARVALLRTWEMALDDPPLETLLERAAAPVLELEAERLVLVGHSLGGPFALALAAHLERQGRTVERVVMLDSRVIAGTPPEAPPLAVDEANLEQRRLRAAHHMRHALAGHDARVDAPITLVDATLADTDRAAWATRAPTITWVPSDGTHDDPTPPAVLTTLRAQLFSIATPTAPRGEDDNG